MFALAFLWIRSNFGTFLIALAIASLLAYGGYLKTQIWYYKRQATANAMVIATLKEKNKALEDANWSITKKYDHSLIEKWAVIETNSKLIREKIKNDKELASIRLSINAVRLFNASKRADEQPKATATIKGNDGGTNPAKTVDVTIETNGKVFSLQDLLLVSEENDRNHNRCVKQVVEWQNFWKDYVSAVKSANRE